MLSVIYPITWFAAGVALGGRQFFAFSALLVLSLLLSTIVRRA